MALPDDVPTSFITEVQTFVKNLFLSGQGDLQSRDHDAADREEEEVEEARGNSSQSPPHVNRFKLNVQTNAVCVDILVWATMDEGGEYRNLFPFCLASLSLFLPR